MMARGFNLSMFSKILLATGLGATAVFGIPKVMEKPKIENSQNITQPNNISRTVPNNKSEAIFSYAPIVKKSSGAVVNVYARSIEKGKVAVDFFGGAFRFPDRELQSQGSGVIVRPNGIIVTNNHVVEGATELVVVLGDKKEYPAKVIVTDPKTDLAVLKIMNETGPLPYLEFASTANAEVGDQVLAIGNPFGVGQTVTSGIISALARTDVGITDYSFFIQTDAAINPGNSGGALVDMTGKLVGINTAIYSQSGNSAGIGFAIPSEMVKHIVDSALSTGKVVRAWSGIKGQTVTNQIATTMNLAKPSGVLVSEVYANSGAANAGVKRGDVIIALDGVEVADENGLRYLAATKTPNDIVKFDVIRNGSKLSLSGRITAPLGTDKTDEKVITQNNSLKGLRIVTLTPYLADNIGIDLFQKGVVVTGVMNNSNASDVGFRNGDVIVDVDGNEIHSVAELVKLMGSNKQCEVTIIREQKAITAILVL